MSQKPESDEIQFKPLNTEIDEVAGQILEGFGTTHDMLSDQSEQISGLYESVTGVQDGPGGREAPYSLVDIGNMLVALLGVFEPHIKAKAFEVFDKVAEDFKKEPPTLIESHYINTFANYYLGIPVGMQKRFYEEWERQRGNQ
jgi:hypothetical protein